jgi:hypothetical protein
MKVLSFGGGVQTVTMVAMCINGDLPKPDFVIFADPQWESKATYDYMEKLKPMMFNAGMPLITRTRGNIRKDALSGARYASMPVFTKLDGKGGMLLRQCTNDYKIQVVMKAIRENLGVLKYKRVKQKVELWLGISVDEAHRMKPSRSSWMENKYPLVDAGMSRSSCIAYLKRKGFEIPPKSACIGCPFHDDSYWKNMQKNSPEEFEDACQFDEAIRTNACKKGSRKSDIFLHRSLRPLRDVKFDDGNLELWGNECEGHCGL